MRCTEARDALKMVSYKPGYSFDLAFFSDGRPTLILWQREVRDANNPDRTVNLRFISEPVSWDDFDLWTEVDLLAFAARTARLLEEHEMYEWLKFDGRRIKDPHNKTDVDDLAFRGALSK